MMRSITSEIFQVGGPGYTVSEDAAIYLINFNGQAALVDAGCGTCLDRLYANISECGVPPETIKYLLITHCHYDHTGGAKKIRDDLSCKTVAHKLDAPYLETGDNTVTAASWHGWRITPFTIDRKLSGPNTDIFLGDRKITAIHIPGHSPGSVAFLTESDGKTVLFGQDVHGPLHPDLRSNRTDYIASLETLLALNADILCEGHFGIYEGKPEVQKFISSFF